MEIFNIHLEFNPYKLFDTIDYYITKEKSGYVCVCDSSVVTRVQKQIDYREIVNGAFVNACDGSSICTLARKIYGGNLVSINGPEIFEKYIKIPYKQVVLGNTEKIVSMVRETLNKEGYGSSHIDHLQLPFCNVEDFDYKGIAEIINGEGYDIVWVSLGNPKQEIFMSRILPHLDRGVMFGIGAALNFWVGELSLPKFHLGSMRFIWLTRIFQDPKRMIKSLWEVLKVLPSMYREEKIKAKSRK